ncbi:hypothetical protein TNCV_4141481 [Trichonephila clavipes]|nr:hypothetical protein TNCV_4141481 [Trichonephila clavipes]
MYYLTTSSCEAPSTDRNARRKNIFGSCAAIEFSFGEGERLAQRRSNRSIVLMSRVSRGKAIFGSSAAIEFIFEAVPRVNSRLVELTTLIVKGKKQDMLQLAEELGINATLNTTVPSIKIAITNTDGYEEEFVKNLYATIITNGKRLEELERAEKIRLEKLEMAEKTRMEELVKEQAH